MLNGPLRRTAINQLLNPVDVGGDGEHLHRPPATPPATPSPHINNSAGPRLHAASWAASPTPSDAVVHTSPSPYPHASYSPWPYPAHPHQPPPPPPASQFYSYPYPDHHVHQAHAQPWSAASHPPPPYTHPHPHMQPPQYYVAPPLPPPQRADGQESPGSSVVVGPGGVVGPYAQLSPHTHGYPHLVPMPVYFDPRRGPPPAFYPPPHPHAHPHAQIYYAYPGHPGHPGMPPPGIQVQQQLQYQQNQQHKRLQDGAEEEPAGAPPKKRARASARSGEAVRRRVQNPKQSDPAESTRSPSVSSTATTMTDASVVSAIDGPTHPELQLARCMSNRYKSESFPRCVACTRRWAGDTCRFQHVRYFRRVGSATGTIVGASFVEIQRPEGPRMRFPSRWNRALDKATIGLVKRTAARSLLGALKEEREHLGAEGEGVICRPRDSDVRATCDTCMSSIFSASWLCRNCGREACASCYATVHELTQPAPGAADAALAAQQALRESHAGANPFFLACTRRSEHSAADFSRTSRFHRGELEEVIGAMEKLLEDEEEEKKQKGDLVEIEPHPESDEGAAQVSTESDHVMSSGVGTNGVGAPAETPYVPESKGSVDSTATLASRGTALQMIVGSSSSSCSHCLARTSAGEVDDTICCDDRSPTLVSDEDNKDKDVDTCLYADEGSHCGIESHKTRKIEAYTLDDDQFGALLVEGYPILVTDQTQPFSTFTPAWFVENYSSASCGIVDPNSSSPARRATVADFFGATSVGTLPTGAKLKDWPVSGAASSAGGNGGLTAFRTALPKVWEALQAGLPFGSYSRPDGARNLASHFPANMPAPELGPRLSAYAPGGRTALHVGPADCVHVLLGDSPDAGTRAVWDIYRADDAAKIRRFLRARAEEGGPGRASAAGGRDAPQRDSVLARSVYMDDAMRAELYAEHGVLPHRVVQRAGEVLFIPAGMLQQVAYEGENGGAPLALVSLDFVSAENVPRCERLVGEVRALNRNMSWREDGLQLQTMLWFAWLSCARLEAERRADVVSGGGAKVVAV